MQTAKMESPDGIDALGKDWLPQAMLFPAGEPAAVRIEAPIVAEEETAPDC